MLLERFSVSGPARPLVAVLCQAIIVWVVFNLFGQQLSHAYALGNQGLTDSGDAYSEANDVRAGEAYHDKGLTSNVGLAEMSYGNAFDNQGGKRDPLLCGDPLPEKCVYLHYPPLPELLIGVSTIVFGKGRVFAYRFIPLLLGLFSLGALGFGLYRAIGPVRSAIVMWLLGGIPMTSNMMHVFAVHAYVTAFFFLQVAALLVAVSRPVPLRRDVIAVGMAAFLQGCTAFDYILHVALLPLAVYLALGNLEDKAQRKWMMLLTVVCASTYAFAMILHFVQVAAYLGGVKAMLADFAQKGKTRLNGSTWIVPPLPGATGILFYYWVNLLPDKKFYDGNFVALVATTVALLLPKRAWFRLGKWGIVRFDTNVWQLASFVLMCLIPCGWLVVMQQHASIHGHFLPRNFTCTILWAYLLLSHSVSFEKAVAKERVDEQPDEVPSERTVSASAAAV